MNGPGARLPLVIIGALVLVSGLGGPLDGQAPQTSATVFQNVRIFDGKSGQLSGPSHVLVRGNRIERISSTPIPTDRRADTVLVDGGGRTLMPSSVRSPPAFRASNMRISWTRPARN